MIDIGNLTYDDLDLIPISEAAKRYFCSISTLERRADEGCLLIFRGGETRMVDRKTGDEWFLSTSRRKSHKSAGSNKSHGSKTGRPRTR